MAGADSGTRRKGNDRGLTPWDAPPLAARPLRTVSAAGYKPSQTLVKAGITAIVASCILGGWTTFGGHLAEGDLNGPDHIDSDEADRRFDAYVHATPLVVDEVTQEDRLRAVAAMGLSASQQQQILADLDETSVPRMGSTPAPAMMAGKERLRLVWLTFWDTDREDGDVVRVDSGMGYTRTINLTRQPMTMAIPVIHGVPVKLKGVRDGEGGGITVGMASGNAHAALPIMSTGQVLSVKVVLP